MRKIKLYIAISLNGKIAKKDGSVDWLMDIPNPDQNDHGYADFYDSIDTTIQGYKTYKQIIDWGIDFPYADKKNYVLTRNSNLENTAHAEFISENHVGFIRNVQKEAGKDIWLIGGGSVNTMLLNEGLIDEIQIFVMPIILTEGIELFELMPTQAQLKLMSTKSFSTGAVEIKYQVIKK
jgi:dihydrofolate reductase